MTVQNAVDGFSTLQNNTGCASYRTAVISLRCEYRVRRNRKNTSLERRPLVRDVFFSSSISLSHSRKLRIQYEIFVRQSGSVNLFLRPPPARLLIFSDRRNSTIENPNVFSTVGLGYPIVPCADVLDVGLSEPVQSRTPASGAGPMWSTNNGRLESVKHPSERKRILFPNGIPKVAETQHPNSDFIDKHAVIFKR